VGRHWKSESAVGQKLLDQSFEVEEHLGGRRSSSDSLLMLVAVS